MSGIIITPGTFNPPATPAQTMDLYTFPKTSDVTLRKPTLSYQLSSRRVVEAAAGAGSVSIRYVRYDYITGLVRIRVADADYHYGKTKATLSGARYAPNGTWPVVATDPLERTYDLATPSVLSAEPIDLGSFLVGPSDSPYQYHVLLGDVRTVTGTPPEDDGRLYLVVDPSTGFGGAVIDGVQGYSVSMYVSPWPSLDKEWDFTDYLLADPYPGTGSLRDWMEAHSSDIVHSRVRVIGSAVLDSALTPVVDSHVTQDVPLYAPDAGTPVPAPLPSWPVTEYVRESWVHQGEVVLS